MDHTNFNAGRRRIVLASMGGAMLGALAARVGAQPAEFGTGPIRLVVPFSPGTTPDLIARLIDPRLAQVLGRSVVVENKPGASGIIGMDAVAKAAPDGHTIMVSTSTALTTPFFYSKMPFDVLHGFQPIGMVGYTNFALVANPAVPASSVGELIEYLKKDPGTVTYASPGKGTFHHLVMEQFASQTGTRMMHVPYKGSAGMFTDLVGGHVSLAIMPLHVAVPLEESGKLRIIGATRGQRDGTFPKVATLQEGGVSGFDVDAWYAVWGPRGMSKEMVRRYSDVLRDTLAVDEVRTKLIQQGVSVQPGAPEALLDTAQAEYAHWKKVIEVARIKPE